MSDKAAMHGVSKAPNSSGRPRLTSRGGGLWAISLTAIIIGFVLPEPRFIHLGLLGMLVLGGSFLWARYNLRHLTYARAAPESAFAGQNFPLSLTLTNGRKRQDAFAVEFQDSVAGSTEKGLHVDWLQAGDTATREMQTRLPRRGMIHRGWLSLESMFPLGLWKSRIEEESKLEMMIYPRPMPPKMFEDPDVLTLLETDEMESALMDWDGDFHGLREFQPGDRMKLIQWPTTARSRHLVVRQFDRRQPSRVTILFHSIRPDARPQPPDVFEGAMELLCGMLLLFRERGTPVDMVASFNQWQSMPVESQGQLDAALRTLALAKRITERNSDALHAALAGVDAGNRVVIFSDVPIKEWESDLLELPCVTICLSIQEMYIRQPRVVLQNQNSTAQV